MNSRDAADYPEQGLTSRIIGCAIEVHRAVGPGLLESAYRACMLRDLELAGLSVQQEVHIGVQYKGQPVDLAYRADLLVAKTVLIELKAVERILPIHKSQLLTYLKLSKLRVGLLVNFNAATLRDGLTRIVFRHY